MTNAPVELLEWDSEFFAFRIARITGPLRSSSAMSEVMDWCKAERIRCVYYLIPSNEIESAQIAHTHNFVPVDIRMTFETRVADIRHDCSRVRPFREGDLPALAAIAKSAHTDSRFYADSGFPRERCDALYELWIESSCYDYSECVLVAEQDGHPAGYITCHIANQTGRIGLLALVESARGFGLGKELVMCSLAHFREHGVEHVNVVTQGRNIAAQRMYQRCGFLTRSVELWYHRWF